MQKRLVCAIMAQFIILFFSPIKAQTTLTIDDCRKAALESNNQVKIGEEKTKVAHALRKMALSDFFPKFTANGTYIWNQNSLHLLTTDEQSALENLGTTVQGAISPEIQQIATQLSAINPQLAQQFVSYVSSLGIEQNLNGFGTTVADRFSMDIHNIYAGAVTVYEPVYMGGKIRQFYKTAKYLEEISNIQLDKEKEDLIVQVDEAYWQVISVKGKYEVAKEYCQLLENLNNNVESMLEEGVATQSDVLKVKVKLNEAQVQLTKAENGLALSKMLLSYLCGLDLYGNYEFEEPDFGATNANGATFSDIAEVWNNRNEIKMLEYADKIALSGVRIARSALLPNVAVQGSYLVTNPNVRHSFANEFAGGFNVGVVVNVPLFHASDFYAVQAAKHERAQVQYQIDDAKKKIELQVNKTYFELQESVKKVEKSEINLSNAEENLRLAEESFHSGMLGSTELMGAQVAWMSAKSDVVDAKIEMQMNRLYFNNALGYKEK